ncbi:MAG TPA: hypothetical protein VKV73_05210 [Chloroflexota bacterium]|nr:hypothetical protein [Chloroflexota bacterium]
MRSRARGSPASEFPVFCAAVRTWLHAAECLDPSLAAVADLVARTSRDVIAADQVAEMAADTGDMHGLLGATGLLSLWRDLANAPLRAAGETAL